MSSFFISIPSCRSPYAIVSARKKSPLRQGVCLHLSRKLHAPAHAGVVHQAGQGKAAVIVCAVLVDVHLFGFHLLRVLSGKDAQKAQIVDANFLAMVPVAKIPHFITVPPGLLLWIRCVQYTMVFPYGKESEKQKCPRRACSNSPGTDSMRRYLSSCPKHSHSL